MFHHPIDRGESGDTFYMDFQKAFDKVQHKRLLAKLSSHRISGNMINWIESFLVGRRHRVRVNGSFSEWAVAYPKVVYKNQHCLSSVSTTFRMTS